MSSDLKLNDIFDGYDSSEPLSASFSDKDLEILSKEGVKNKNNEKLLAPKTKKDGIIAIVKKVEKAINTQLPADKRVKVDLTFTAVLANSEPGGGRKGVFIQPKNNSGDVGMNINIKRLSKLPALEVYSIIYCSLYKFANRNENEEDLDYDLALDLGSDDNKADGQDEKKKNNSKAKAIECLAGYLNKFLPKYFDGKFKEFTAISNLVAKQIVEEMGEEDFEKILSIFFKFEKLDSKAERIVENFLGESEGYRLEFLNYKATELLLDPKKEAVGLNYLQQSEELLSVSTKNKFRDAINSESKSLADFKDFCVSYANRFMNSNNLANINVTFNPEGALGEFYDSNPPRINVNLNRIDSISELAATLSHELTHAVDSCTNRAKGNFDRENNSGLLNNISEDISSSGLKESDPAYSFLRELKNYCYHVNPNERHARIGELSALNFIDEMSKDKTIKNVNLRGQLSTSISKFVAYQERTVKMMNELSSEKIESWENRLNGEFKNIPSKAKEMIKERIKYLEGMIGAGLGIEAEQESIEAARRILEQKQKEQEAKKVAEQEALKNSAETQRGE